MDKNKIKNKLKDDPAFTLEVQNPEVEALMKGGGAIEEEATFAVIGATIADNFGVKMPEGTIGHSILEEL